MTSLHGSLRPGGAGSELTRLLALLSGPPAPGPRPDVAERLGHWLGWTGAIALSTALGTRPTPPDEGRPPAIDRLESDVHRVCAALEASIAAGPRDLGAASPTDFAPYRRHCLERQQAMQDAVAALRSRLREALTQQSAEGARLAAIDAALDQPLGSLEQGLLGLVVLRLQARFEQLHRAGADGADDLTGFHEELAQLLRAELAHRLLPVHGLLAALRHD